MPHQEYVGSDGKVWPSATQLTGLIPKDWLMAWYKRSVEKKGWQGWLDNLATSEIGKETGTLVHYYLECLTKKQEIKGEDKYNARSIAQSLYDTVNPTVEEYVEIEPHLVSEELKIHGTADIIYRKVYTPGLRIGDYKTSYDKDISHPIQLAIYALCWNESHPDQMIDVGDIFRVDKKSARYNVKIDEYTNLGQYYPLVRALRLLWSYTNEED